MSRTSSEPTGASMAQFRRAFSSLVAALLVASAVFLGIGFLQGPRLVEAQIDTNASVVRGEQPLRLFLNQPIEAVVSDQVTVTPDTATTVTTANDVVAVQFANALDYDVEYTVRIEGVRGLGLPQTSAVEYRFRTPAASYTYLDRGETTDRIVRARLPGGEQTVLFSAVGIQEYAISGRVLAVTTQVNEKESALQLVSLADGIVEAVVLPERGLVSNLDATTAGYVLGFTLSPLTPTSEPLGGRQLLLLDIEAGREFTTVAALDGERMQIAEWLFVPGETRLVVQSIDTTIFVVDAVADSIPTPLGRVSEIVRVSRDGTSLAARDALGGVLIDLADGGRSRLEPSPIEGRVPFVGLFERLQGGSIIEKAALEVEPGVYVVIVAIDDGLAGRIIYAAPDFAGSGDDLSVSPNGQYAVLETVPAETVPVFDGYSVQPRPATVKTIFIEIATGAIVASVDGFGVRW